MIINLHNGKTMRVSEKRFNEYSKKEENREDWLQFRMKHFGFSREELIMHPRSWMLFSDDDGFMRISFFRGKFSVGRYGKDSDKEFDTPEEAYQFMTSKKGGKS